MVDACRHCGFGDSGCWAKCSAAETEDGSESAMEGYEIPPMCLTGSSVVMNHTENR